MAGTRMIRVNMKAVIGLMRWPFPAGTSVHVQAHKLPDDATFVKIVRVEDPYVTILLVSNAWHGHSDLLLTPPEFKYETKGGHIALPNTEEILRRGPH